jgi:hypothetical protein
MISIPTSCADRSLIFRGGLMLMPGLPDFIASQQYSPMLAGALGVPAPVVWTRFCSSGGQLHQLVLTGFKG